MVGILDKKRDNIVMPQIKRKPSADEKVFHIECPSGETFSPVFTRLE